MTNFICTTCGTQYAATDQPPPSCPICEDERQYVRATGQAWTTLAALRATHRNSFHRYESGLYGIGTTPDFGIGQRALLLRRPQGNVLWDCIALIDDATVDLIGALGGLAAIAISHPHYYTTMAEWSRAFGGVPIYLHAADRQWVMRPDPAIVYWEGGQHKLADDLTLIQGGGHFDGAAVMHWSAGAEGSGALFTGDTIQVVVDNRWVSFMYSYPNLVPLPASAIHKLTASVDAVPFERIYGAFWGRTVNRDGKAALARSAARYLAAIKD